MMKTYLFYLPYTFAFNFYFSNWMILNGSYDKYS